MSLIYNLMHSAVDYAGLFPPAGLPMQQIVDNYAKYRESAERSMLGRLIIPANKLSLFENAAGDFLPHDEETPPWRISALVPPVEFHSNSCSATELESAMETIHVFNEKHLTEGDVSTVIDAVEVKAASIAAIEATLERVSEPITAFLEVPHQSDPTGLIKSIREKGAGKRVFAKIRTGGISADVIPSVAEVARFISACATHRVGFKATAGLHHPLRAEYRLTYRDDSPKSLMHGFLNVFVAAAIAFEHSVSPDTLTSILSSQSPADFNFENEKLSWENFEVSAERVLELRKNGIISFGSCSFVEPTMELQRIPSITYQSIFSS